MRKTTCRYHTFSSITQWLRVNEKKLQPCVLTKCTKNRLPSRKSPFELKLSNGPTHVTKLMLSI